jgi:hypothetical protein
MAKNVLGTELESCSHDPLTGWLRDGCCNTDLNDEGIHTVCGIMTDVFLDYLVSIGNDLRSSNPHFPGLKSGDSWCLCAWAWLRAYREGMACKINLNATHEETLAMVPLSALKEYSHLDL